MMNRLKWTLPFRALLCLLHPVWTLFPSQQLHFSVQCLTLLPVCPVPVNLSLMNRTCLMWTKSIWTKSIVYTQTKSIGYRTKSISHIFLYKHLCDIYLSNMNCISVIFQYFKAFFTLQDSVRDFCTHICFNVGLGINII